MTTNGRDYDGGGLLNVLRSDTICPIIHNLFGPEGAKVRPTIEAVIGGSDVSIEQGLVFVQEDSYEERIGRRGYRSTYWAIEDELHIRGHRREGTFLPGLPIL